jgi:hypothetical protein
MLLEKFSEFIEKTGNTNYNDFKKLRKIGVQKAKKR